MNDQTVQEIRDLTCRRVSNFAHYVFIRGQFRVLFGTEEISITDLCAKFPDCPARSISIEAMCGPPGKCRFRRMNLAQLVEDWYYFSIATKNHDILGKFRRAMFGPTLANTAWGLGE